MDEKKLRTIIQPNNEELFVPYANVMPEIVDVDDKTMIVIQVPEGESVYQLSIAFLTETEMRTWM